MGINSRQWNTEGIDWFATMYLAWWVLGVNVRLSTFPGSNDIAMTISAHPARVRECGRWKIVIVQQGLLDAFKLYQDRKVVTRLILNAVFFQVIVSLYRYHFFIIC